MASKEEKREWELPHLREAHKLPATENEFWDVQFYPFSEVGVDPVFAVVGGKRILICRPSASRDSSGRVEVLHCIIDEEFNSISESEHDTSSESDRHYENHFSIAWSKDVTTGEPILIVGGENGKIKILNALTGKCQRVLTGHGGEVNALAICPINPSIMASASDDCTVRIWSLDPAHESQPCAAVLEGDGHKETVLSVAFHKNGRYLLSGGVDHVINLWTLPLFSDINAGPIIPTRIFYPHFSTSEVHADIVDCVAWHGDLILSKAAKEHNIVLWSINNFDSTLEPPSPDAAPTTHDVTRDTRSAFMPANSSTPSNLLYTRHVQFAIPDSSLIYMRFSLFNGCQPMANNESSQSSQSSTKSTPPNNSNPVLAFCNEASKVFFWDLSRLENYHDIISTTSDSESFTAPPKHPFLHPFQNRKRGGGALGRLSTKRQRTTSPTESNASSQVTASDEQYSSHRDESQEGRGRSRKSQHAFSSFNSSSSLSVDKKEDKERSRSIETGPGKVDWVKTRKGWREKYDISDPLKEITAHWTDVIKGLTVVGRQVGWSPDGRWCVVVGSDSVIACFQRWKD